MRPKIKNEVQNTDILKSIMQFSVTWKQYQCKNTQWPRKKCTKFNVPSFCNRLQ